MASGSAGSASFTFRNNMRPIIMAHPESGIDRL